MADVPEYKRKQQITPAADRIGFDKALEGLSDSRTNAVNAKENNITANVNKSLATGNEKSKSHEESAHKLVAGRAVADFLSNVGQNAGMERARLSGIEAAKNPGQTFLPAINQTDAEFRKSYQAEELASVGFQANRYLDKIKHEANLDPKPSAKTLEEYQKNAAKQSQIFVNQVSPENQKALERNLMGTYDAGYYQIATNVENHNRKFLKTQAAVQFDQNADEIYDNAKLGLKEGAQEKFQWAIDNINRLVQVGTIDEQEGANRRKEARRKLSSGEYNRAVEEAIKDGRYDEFIKDKQENKPANMTPTEHEEVMIQTRQYASNYQAALTGQQTIEHAQARVALQNGEINSTADLEDRKQRMGPLKAAAFEVEVAKFNNKKAVETDASKHILQNASNPIYLSNVTPAPINKAVDNFIIPQAEAIKGGKLTLTEQSQLLSDFKAPVESFQDRVSAGLTAGNAEQRYDSAKAVQIAKEQNPTLLRGMSKDDMALAGMYEKFLTDPQYQTPDGPDKIKDKVMNVKEEVKKERAVMFNTYVSDAQLNNYDILRARTFKALDLKFDKKTKLDPGTTTVYMNNLRDAFNRTGDKEIAVKEASAQLKEAYGKEGDKVTYMPPSHVYTNLGYVLNNDKANSVKQMVDHNEAIRSKGGFTLNKIEWPNAPKTEDLLSGPIHDKPIELLIDGKLRRVEFQSDATTQFSNVNDISWALGYVNDVGVTMPLINPHSITNQYRFIPNKELYNQAQSNVEVMKKVSQYEITKEADEYRQEVLDSALKKREENRKKPKVSIIGIPPFVVPNL